MILIPDKSSFINAFIFEDFCLFAFQCFSAIMEIRKIPRIITGRLHKAARASLTFFANIIAITRDYMLTTKHTTLGGYLEEAEDIDLFEFSDDSYIAFKHKELQPGETIKFLGYGIYRQTKFHRVFTTQAY